MLSGKQLGLFGMVTLLLLMASPAYAASSTPATAGAPLFIALAIAYLSRRRSVGGWLFYYYFQLYGSVLIVFLIGAAAIDNFKPASWDDNALYGLFIISVVPVYLVKAAEVIMASKLLMKRLRNTKNVNYLRYTLVAAIIFNLIGVIIDYYHFIDNIAFSTLTLVFSIIWYFYFTDSYRVYYVFNQWEGKWNYEAFRHSKSIKQRAIPK